MFCFTISEDSKITLAFKACLAFCFIVSTSAAVISCVSGIKEATVRPAIYLSNILDTSNSSNGISERIATPNSSFELIPSPA